MRRNYIFELDDFRTRKPQTKALFRFKKRYPNFKATLFTLLGLSSEKELVKLAKLDWVELALHGWDHFSELGWGYWEARHFLEYAETVGCFVPLMKMPWNRLPRLGFIKALKERNVYLVTPKRIQALALKATGLKVACYTPDLWLHPVQLSGLESLGVKRKSKFKFSSGCL